MKNTLLILLSTISITLAACGGASDAKDDFSSPKAAANSYFNVLKLYNKDSVKSILLTYDEFIELKNSTPAFAQGLANLGEGDQVQYEGSIKETINDYTKNFASSAARLFLSSKNMPNAKYLGAEAEEEEFSGLTVAPVSIKFEVDGKKYETKLRAVKVGDKWKAVYFGPIQMAR